MKTNRRLSLSIAMVVLAFGTLLSVPPIEAGEKFSWTLVTPFPISDATTPRMIEWAKEVEKETDGEFRIKVLVAGQHPYQYRDGLKIVTDGLAQLSHTGLTYLTSVESWFALPLVPFAVPFDKHMDFLVRWHERIANPYLEKKYNLKVLTYFLDAGGWGNAIHTPVPLERLDSLKGLKIRAHDKYTSFLAQTLGAVPATVPYSELYVALQRKSIDGVMTSLVGAYGQKLWEIVKNTTMYEPYFGVDEIVVSADAWAKVPPPLQQKLNTLLQKWVGRESMYAYHSKRNEEIMKEAQEKYGAKFTTPSPAFTAQMREKCGSLLDAYVKDGGDMAKQSVDLLNELMKK